MARNNNRSSRQDDKTREQATTGKSAQHSSRRGNRQAQRDDSRNSSRSRATREEETKIDETSVRNKIADAMLNDPAYYFSNKQLAEDMTQHSFNMIQGDRKSVV